MAGIGLIRNIAGAGFPLFANAFYVNVGFEWASCILGFLALLLVPIPFVLSKYGRALRLRSPWAKQHMDDLSEEEHAYMVDSVDGEDTSTKLASPNDKL